MHRATNIGDNLPEESASLQEVFAIHAKILEGSSVHPVRVVGRAIIVILHVASSTKSFVGRKGNLYPICEQVGVHGLVACTGQYDVETHWGVTYYLNVFVQMRRKDGPGTRMKLSLLTLRKINASEGGRVDFSELWSDGP